MVSHIADSPLNKTVDLIEGDILLGINGEKLRYFDELEGRLLSLKNQSVNATFLRGNEEISRSLNINENGKLGIFRAEHPSRFNELGYYNIKHKDYTFFESFAGGVQKFGSEVSGYFDQLKKIFTPSTGAIKGIGGFKAIFDVFQPDVWNWEAFWGLTAFLSIMLAILNLLPIPALDGGHVMFLLFEMVSGKKPSEKFLERAQVVGFFILIALVLFANGNDIYKAIVN